MLWDALLDEVQATNESGRKFFNHCLSEMQVGEFGSIYRFIIWRHGKILEFYGRRRKCQPENPPMSPAILQELDILERFMNTPKERDAICVQYAMFKLLKYEKM